MDPLTAFGLAANATQFLVWSIQFVKTAAEVVASGHGVTESNLSWETAVREVNQFSSKLRVADSSKLVGDEMVLYGLANQRQTLSKDMLALFNRIKPKDAKAKVQVVWALLKSKHYELEVMAVQRSLEVCHIACSIGSTHQGISAGTASAEHSGKAGNSCSPMDFDLSSS
jgi:hypothetical protein